MKMKNNSVDSVVTDPPYGLSFMNKKWDHDVPSVEFWKEVLRVLKPGGHVLSFGGTRTYHRMAVNIEDAGFEIRDQIMWLYGSGFPKSYNVSKGIDKKFGVEREVIGINEKDVRKNAIKNNTNNTHNAGFKPEGSGLITAPGHDLAKQWDGFGTALKPANEPIVLARKPLSEKNIVDNVLKWGTGAINVDGCRVETSEKWEMNGQKKVAGIGGNFLKGKKAIQRSGHDQGRFPANVILDEIAAEMLDEQSGSVASGYRKNPSTQSGSNFHNNNGVGERDYKDNGGASRFFYCAKASKSERNAGLEGMPEKSTGHGNLQNSKGMERFNTFNKNHHPTVKPIKLMRYLCRLITPPGGTVLDPFMGSGTTGIAAQKEGFEFIGIELEKEYFEIAERRIG